MTRGCEMVRRPRNDPDPGYYEFEGPGFSVGEANSHVHAFLYDAEYEEYLAEMQAKEKRRIKPGFNVKDSKRPVRKQRPAS
jgi:hypothetical protein